MIKINYHIGETAQHLISLAPQLRLVAKSARLAVLLDQLGERTGIHELHRRVHARLGTYRRLLGTFSASMSSTAAYTRASS